MLFTLGFATTDLSTPGDGQSFREFPGVSRKVRHYPTKLGLPDSRHLLNSNGRLDVAFGGRVAEELIYGKDNITSGASSDIANATHVANLMVRRYGFGSENLGPVLYDEDEKLSPHTKAMVEDEIKGLIEGAQARATAILKSHRIELERLANALVEYETLTHADVLKVISGHKLDKETV